MTEVVRIVFHKLAKKLSMKRQVVTFFSLVLSFFFVETALFAQAETLLYGSHLAQAVESNPALLNDHRLVLIQPSFYNNTFFTGPTLDDAFTDVNGQQLFDTQGFLNALDEENNLLRQQFSINTLGGALRLGGAQLSLTHAFRLEAQASYPKEMAELALLGNSQFVGDTIQLDHDLQLFSYSEFALGGAVKVGPLQAGVRLKWLNGIGALSTETGALSLYTDPGVYDITFTSDYLLNSSSIASLSLADSLQFSLSPSNLDFKKWITKNQGFALDLGVIFNLGGLRLSASALNALGAIQWTENLNNYSSSTEVTYSGVDLTALFTDDSLDFPTALDTLKSLVQLAETQQAFSTALPSTYRLGASYSLSEFLELGGLLALQKFKDQTYKTLAVYATFVPIGWVHLQASYSIVNDTYTNIGLGASVQLGPLQLYGMSDNVPALFNISGSRHFQGRVGANLVLGRKRR